MKKKKILVIDDEEEICKLMAEDLSEVGYEVITETKGETGLERAIQEQPDLIILDIYMPGMDGIALYEELRKTPQHEKTPVIFFTGLAQGIDSERSFGNRADSNYAVLAKPVTLDELDQKIQEFLSK